MYVVVIKGIILSTNRNKSDFFIITLYNYNTIGVQGRILYFFNKTFPVDRTLTFGSSKWSHEN